MSTTTVADEQVYAESAAPVRWFQAAADARAIAAMEGGGGAS